MDADTRQTVLRMTLGEVPALMADDGYGHLAAATDNRVTQAGFSPPLVAVGG